MKHTSAAKSSADWTIVVEVGFGRIGCPRTRDQCVIRTTPKRTANVTHARLTVALALLHCAVLELHSHEMYGVQRTT